jgi:hypothetical protein
MALLTTRTFKDSTLILNNPDTGLYKVNHIFEPEYHQSIYADICEELSKTKNAFQICDCKSLVEYPHRGIQPTYADDETEPDSLIYEGQLLDDGSYRQKGIDINICAIKSISIRNGYIDFDSARSVTQSFYRNRKNKAGVQKNDVLINSTGDGTIGRVSIYNEEFPSLVDGHVTILRFNDPDLAWYIGSFLLGNEGQKQIYRYINGSSGQVEIYPQDIARIWIRLPGKKKLKAIAESFRSVNAEYKKFRENLRKSLNML